MYEHKDAMLLTKGCSPMPSSVLNVVSVKVILFSVSIVFTFSIAYGCVCVGGPGGETDKKKVFCTDMYYSSVLSLI